MYIRVGENEYFRPQIIAGMRKESHGKMVEETLLRGGKGIEQQHFIVGRRGVKKRRWRGIEESWATYHAELTEEEAAEWLEKSALSENAIQRFSRAMKAGIRAIPAALAAAGRLLG